MTPFEVGSEGYFRSAGADWGETLANYQLRVLSVAGAFALWSLLSIALPVGSFPGPIAASTALIGDVLSGDVFKHLSFTLLRVFGGLTLAMAVAAPTGICMGLSARAEKALDIWVMITLAVPSLCYALICYIIFGLNEFAAITAIAITGAPSIAVNVWEGVKSIDGRLLQMASSFRAPRHQILRHVILPQVMPYILASLRFGMGIIWKIAVLVELLGRPNGVGFELYYWYELADMRQVLAWTLLFTLVMLFVELVIFKRLERALFAWRPRVAL